MCEQELDADMQNTRIGFPAHGSFRGSAICAIVAFAMLLPARAIAGDWPQWRGPRADGVSEETAVPVRWSLTENLAWKVRLSGEGASTPIVMGERVFVTAQIGRGPVLSAQNARDVTKTNGSVEFAVLCVRADDGELLWERRIRADEALTPVHPMHNLASPSCVSDGTRIIASFGTGDVLCFDLDGKELWRRDIARDYSPFKLRWGHAGSPVLYKNLLILQADHNPAAYLLALDKTSGKTVWRVERGRGLRSYSTPFVAHTSRRDELIINSNPRIDAYAPATGKPLWHAGAFCKVPVPMPVFAKDVLYLSRGSTSGPLSAIRTGGDGDVSATHTLWRVATGAPYVASPLLYRGVIYLVDEKGILKCVDPESGKRTHVERLGGKFWASPVAADGRIYLLNEDAETVVLQAGPTPHVIARNPLEGVAHASPAISDGRIFIRSNRTLYCVRNAQR